MALPDAASPETVADALAGLDGWASAGDRLTVTYRFADFETAIGFMAAVAPHARELNHHPEWSNVYNRVSVELTTHDIGGLSMLDIELAGRMAGLAARFGGSPA